MKFGIVIINYNGESMLEHCLTELLSVDLCGAEVIMIDNDSTDNSVKLVEKNFTDLLIHQTGYNGGYSGGAEEAVKLAREREWKYLMLMNADIVFERDYLKLMIDKMESDDSIGAIIGKLKQYKFFKREKTNIIDSAGVAMFRDRRAVDRGQAKEDTGQYDEEERVFGVTGAAPFYRVSALNDIEISGEVFDRDFFMYKEDVDIGWRLNLFGWKCWYLPSATAFHGRGTGIEDRSSYMKIARKRAGLSKFQKQNSFRNQHFIQIKNDQWRNILKDFFPIVRKEILVLLFMVLREPYLMKSLFEVFANLPKMLRKRREIMRRAKAEAKEIRSLFSF